VSTSPDPTLDLQKLQFEVMQQLEVIADDIKAGRLDAAEGAAKAKALIAVSEQRRIAMFDAAVSASQRHRRRGWMLAVLVVAAIATVLAGLLLVRISSAG